MEKRALEKQFSFCHFVHEHPLEHTNSPPNENSICSACNLKISQQGNNSNSNNNNNNNHYYTCKTCPSFFLHKVCHNMPKKTQHPSHPNHYLTLQISSSSIRSTQHLKCEACEDHINGHFYTCEECGLCYHILCTSLPLSISVSCHTHQLKLTFSPPYNFSCDICGEPSYNGSWLYRCQICEFDTHLICAVSRNSQSSLGRISVDYCNEIDQVMHLVCQNHCDREIFHHGSDFISLQSPTTNCYTPSPVFEEKQSRHQISPLTPVSEEMSSAVTSFQYSETCFSIDLARSYSGYSDPTKQGAKSSSEAIYCDGKIEVKRIDHGNIYGDDHEANLEMRDFKQQKQVAIYGNNGTSICNHNYSFNVGRDQRLKKEFPAENDTFVAKEQLGQKGKKGNHKVFQDRPGGSSWQKLLICFCYAS